MFKKCVHKSCEKFWKNSLGYFQISIFQINHHLFKNLAMVVKNYGSAGLNSLVTFSL